MEQERIMDYNAFPDDFIAMPEIIERILKCTFTAEYAEKKKVFHHR